MMTLLLVLSAVSATAPSTYTHREVLEHQGMAYDIVYQPNTSSTERPVMAITARGHRLHWCRTTTRIAVTSEVRLPDGTVTASHRLPGERRVSTQLVGSCDQNRALIAAATARHWQVIGQHVRALAAAGRPSLLAKIDAARALAVN